VGVLVVDDQEPFRAAARRMLEAGDSYAVIAEATSGEEAVAIARRLRPALVLMDVRLPGTSGIEATRLILLDVPETVVVLVSTHRRADLPADLAHCGAAAFHRKEDIDPDRLTAALASRWSQTADEPRSTF